MPAISMPRTLSLNLTKQGKIVFLHIIYHRNAVLILLFHYRVICGTIEN